MVHYSTFRVLSPSSQYRPLSGNRTTVVLLRAVVVLHVHQLLPAQPGPLRRVHRHRIDVDHALQPADDDLLCALLPRRDGLRVVPLPPQEGPSGPQHGRDGTLVGHRLGTVVDSHSAGFDKRLCRVAGATMTSYWFLTRICTTFCV